MMANAGVVSARVRVGVRVKPSLNHSINGGDSSSSDSRSILDVFHGPGGGSGSRRTITNNGSSKSLELSGRRFTYDTVFDGNATQEDIYDAVAPDLLQSFLLGYNATVRRNAVLLLLHFSTLPREDAPGDECGKVGKFKRIASGYSIEKRSFDCE
jgi:hypothetical protein